jgi:hypothetical protein
MRGQRRIRREEAADRDGGERCERRGAGLMAQTPQSEPRAEQSQYPGEVRGTIWVATMSERRGFACLNGRAKGGETRLQVNSEAQVARVIQ